MSDLHSPAAPTLTMPEAEAALLRATYAEAGVILEYGMGGSTVLAARLAREAVISVESDRRWYQRMKGWLAANPAPVPVLLHHVDIGPTKEWGFPADRSKVEVWTHYPLSVWDRADFRHPDVVLVDGRFRLGCLLATLFRIKRPVRLLCDDYAQRPQYHAFEKLAGAPAMTGRMAAFTVTPHAMDTGQLGWIIPAFGLPA